MIRMRLRPRLAGMAIIIAMVASTMTVLSSPASALTVLPGIPEVVSAPSLTNSNSSKTVKATCPNGKRVVGSGAEINGGRGDVVIEAIQPAATSVVATAREDRTATTRNWNVTASAICANDSLDMQIVPAFGPTNSNTPKSTTASCGSNTSSTLRVTGSGFAIGGGFGQVVIDDLRPSPADPLNVVATAREKKGTTGNWSVTAFAICARVLL